MINEEDIFWMKLKGFTSSTGNRVHVVITHELHDWAQRITACEQLCAGSAVPNYPWITWMNSTPWGNHHPKRSIAETHQPKVLISLWNFLIITTGGLCKGKNFGQPNEKHLWYNTLQVCSWSLQVSMWCWKTLLCYIN